MECNLLKMLPIVPTAQAAEPRVHPPNGAPDRLFQGFPQLHRRLFHREKVVMKRPSLRPRSNNYLIKECKLSPDVSHRPPPVSGRTAHPHKPNSTSAQSPPSAVAAPPR